MDAASLADLQYFDHVRLHGFPVPGGGDVTQDGLSSSDPEWQHPASNLLSDALTQRAEDLCEHALPITVGGGLGVVILRPARRRVDL